jgi:RNA polymerase sigma factor (sigma-70 family)
MNRLEQMSALNTRVLDYQRTGAGLEELIDRLSPRIYYYPRHRPGLDEDDCGDFYVYFYPRLIRTLKHFREQGKPFDHYLNSVLRWQLRSYLRRKNSDKQRRALACRPDFWETPEPEVNSPAPGTLWPGEHLPVLSPEGIMKSDSDRRRFLLLLLKNMQLLDPRELEAGASLCGLSAEELTRVTAELRKRLAAKEARLEALRTRRNRAFFKLSRLEAELGAAAETAEKRRLLAAVARARATLRLAQERLARTPRCPTNRDLAEVLGLPKGTVDTALYWLKKRLACVYAQHTEDGKRYA